MGDGRLKDRVAMHFVQGVGAESGCSRLEED